MNKDNKLILEENITGLKYKKNLSTSHKHEVIQFSSSLF